jgi:glycerophosphoryl diester phosphodiesterase
LVVELKHATYFASIGLPLDELLERELDVDAQAGPPPDLLVIESFERSVLDSLQERRVAAKYVYLLDDRGAAFDLRADSRQRSATYAEQLTDEGLAAMGPPARSGLGEPRLDGISVSKSMILEPSADGHRNVVARAHALGLEVFCWTFRPENAFLSPRYRTGPPASFGDWRGEFDELIGAGVDGLFVDHPDLPRSRPGPAGV